jgi:hypothetical protein
VLHGGAAQPAGDDGAVPVGLRGARRWVYGAEKWLEVASDIELTVAEEALSVGSWGRTCR